MEIALEWGDVLAATAGGVMIGLAAALLLVFNGRIAGISGILGGVLEPRAGEWSWRGTFLVGLLVGGVLLRLFYPAAFAEVELRPLGAIGAAGLLVGFGTRLGSGCTSGHGVCGLARFSKRSLVAVLTFMAAGAVTATAARLVMGG